MHALPPCRAGSQVEYKYVVRNGDGTPTVWKPGSNLQLPLQGSGAADGGLPGALRISDAWDESWRRVEARCPVSSVQPTVRRARMSGRLRTACHRV